MFFNCTTKDKSCTEESRLRFMQMQTCKTMDLRVRRQSETAMKIAQFLEKHPKVTKVQTLNLIGTLKLEEGIEIGTRRRRHEELNV